MVGRAHGEQRNSDSQTEGEKEIREELPLTVEQAALAARVSMSSISKAIEQGRLKASKKGRKWLILPSDLARVTFRAANGKRGKDSQRKVEQVRRFPLHGPFTPALERAVAFDGRIPQAGSAEEFLLALTQAMRRVNEHERRWYVVWVGHRWMVSDSILIDQPYLELRTDGQVRAWVDLLPSQATIDG